MFIQNVLKEHVNTQNTILIGVGFNNNHCPKSLFFILMYEKIHVNWGGIRTHGLVLV